MSETHYNTYDDEPVVSQRNYVDHDSHCGHQRPDSSGPWFLEEEDIIVIPLGPFGRSPMNPVLVNTIGSEVNYLERSRSSKGAYYFYHRFCSLSQSQMRSNRPGGLYELVSSDGFRWERLCFSPYHFRRSIQAPGGMRLVIFSSMMDAERRFANKPKSGTNARVKNFPMDLPYVIEMHNKGARGSFGQAFANAVRRILANRQGWNRPADFSHFRSC